MKRLAAGLDKKLSTCLVGQPCAGKQILLQIGLLSILIMIEDHKLVVQAIRDYLKWEQ